MPKPKEPPSKIGTPVTIDIAQGLNVAQGTISAADYDDGWMYRIEITSGDDCHEHRNEAGELWVNDFEVRPMKTRSTQQRPGYRHTIEIVDDLMMVLDEDGNGHDCHVITTRLAAEQQLRQWQSEYTFDDAEALKTLAEYFGD